MTASTATPAPEATRSPVVFNDEYKGGWRYVRSWDPQTNEFTLTITGKLVQTSRGNTQTATFVVPAELGHEIWEHPFRHRDYLVDWVEHPDGD